MNQPSPMDETSVAFAGNQGGAKKTTSTKNNIQSPSTTIAQNDNGQHHESKGDENPSKKHKGNVRFTNRFLM
jgi:hypothetical protein